MQHKDAQNPRKAWDGRLCDHLNITRAHGRGAHAGYVCTQCGKWHYERDGFCKKISKRRGVKRWVQAIKSYGSC